MTGLDSVVRPELGPTLPALLGPRIARLPRALRLSLAGLAAAAVAVVVWLLVAGPGDGRTHVVVDGPVAFNLLHGDGLQRVAPHSGEILRLETRSDDAAPQSFAVRPLRLDHYRGDVNAHLALLAASLIEQMRATVPGFAWRGDGRVAIHKQPGHQIVFQARIDGRTTYGRRVLLVVGPDPPPREGVDVLMLAARSNAVPSLDVVGANGKLKLPYRSFWFGTESP